MNVATNLEVSARYFPNHPALSCEGKEITYAQFNEEANRIATALIKLGIKPGDHVGICSPNSMEWLIFYYGILKMGGVAITLSALLSPDELRLLLNHSKPRILYLFDERLQDVENLRGPNGVEKVICPNGDMTFQNLLEMGSKTYRAINRDRDDTAAVLYTGGTTGVPKGVMTTHLNINTSAHNVAFSERSTENDRALCFLPFNHVFGQMHVTNATIISAGCLEILPTFDMDKVLALIKAGRVTKLFCVPTVYTRFLSLDNLKELMSNVRYCFSAAAAMSAEIVKQWRESSGLLIYEGYGMTESASAVTYNHFYRHVIGSIGTTVPGVEVEIRDISTGELLPARAEGEICIRGNNIMKGYLYNPEATHEAFWHLNPDKKRLWDNWFRSGDVGYADEEGYVFIVDRLKDMIITGGENVYSTEVEDAIYAKPEVQECAVIGIPDREWGEKVAAFIILKPGKSVRADEMKTFLKSRLAPFKVPKIYEFVTDLPKTGAGKILKRAIRAEYIEKK
ncbi:MAG: AMP-binding protein [Deltaproteobacteria bacterium]|nr:AMP-binding protein [Deltaproteobacteria bacterium]